MFQCKHESIFDVNSIEIHIAKISSSKQAIDHRCIFKYFGEIKYKKDLSS